MIRSLLPPGGRSDRRHRLLHLQQTRRVGIRELVEQQVLRAAVHRQLGHLDHLTRVGRCVELVLVAEMHAFRVHRLSRAPAEGLQHEPSVAGCRLVDHSADHRDLALRDVLRAPGEREELDAQIVGVLLDRPVERGVRLVPVQHHHDGLLGGEHLDLAAALLQLLQPVGSVLGSIGHLIGDEDPRDSVVGEELLRHRRRLGVGRRAVEPVKAGVRRISVLLAQDVLDREDDADAQLTSLVEVVADLLGRLAVHRRVVDEFREARVLGILQLPDCVRGARHSRAEGRDHAGRFLAARNGTRRSGRRSLGRRCRLGRSRIRSAVHPACRHGGEQQGSYDCFHSRRTVFHWSLSVRWW